MNELLVKELYGRSDYVGPYTNKSKSLALLFAGKSFNKLMLLSLMDDQYSIVKKILYKEILPGNFVDCSFSPKSKIFAVITYNPKDREYNLNLFLLENENLKKCIGIDIKRPSAAILGWDVDEKWIVLGEDVGFNNCCNCERTMTVMTSKKGRKVTFDFEDPRYPVEESVDLTTLKYEKCGRHVHPQNDKSTIFVQKAKSPVSFLSRASTDGSNPVLYFPEGEMPTTNKRIRIDKEEEEKVPE